MFVCNSTHMEHDLTTEDKVHVKSLTFFQSSNEIHRESNYFHTILFWRDL